MTMDILNNMNFKHSTLCLLGSFIFIGGCATPKLDTSKVNVDQGIEDIQSAGLTLDTQIKQTQTLLNRENTEVNLKYAPLHLRKAKSECLSAEKIVTKDEIAATRSLALCKQLLSEIPLTVDRIKASVEPLEKTISDLMVINSHTLHKGDFEDLNESLANIIALYESDSPSIDGALIEFKQDAVDLEVETLKSIHLDPIATKMEEADNLDADYFAPQTYRKAESLIAAATLAIENQYKNRNLVAEESLKALRGAEHAVNASIAVKSILQIGPEKAEQHIYMVEGLLRNIGQALGYKDVSHLKLEDQSNAIAQVADIQKKRLDNQLKTPSGWEDEKQRLLQRIAELTEEKNQLENN